MRFVLGRMAECTGHALPREARATLLSSLMRSLEKAGFVRISKPGIHIAFGVM